MFLKIKKSSYMDLSPLKGVENYICRLAKNLRREYNLPRGSYIKLEGPNKKEIILQVEPAYIEDISNIPDFNGMYVTSRIATCLGVDKPKLNLVNELTLGMDPECYVINQKGYMLEAKHFFDTFLIGHDCGLLEFRPNPSTTPQGLIKNLFGLIKKASDKITNEDRSIIAGSCYNLKPAGFHIHFGYNSGLKEHTDQIKMIGGLLDYLLAVLLLTKEVREDSFRRSDSDYGKPGDIKRSEVSFEYRCPGGRLMESPILATGAVALAEVIVKDFLIKCNDITDNLKYPEKFCCYSDLQKVYPTLPSKPLIKEVLTNVEKTERYIVRLEENILRTIESLNFYKERKKEINNFLNYESNYYETDLYAFWSKEYQKM